MRAASQRRLTPLLVLAMAILGALLAVLLLGVGEGVRWAAPRDVASLPPAGSGAALPAPLPLDHFARVWQKPLFSPDRQPLVLADAGDSVGDLELTGVIITPTVRMVLAHDKSHDRDLRMHEGRSAPDGRWTLVEVRPRSAVFDSPNGRVELKLPAGAPFSDQKHDGPTPAGASAGNPGTAKPDADEGGDQDAAQDQDQAPPPDGRMGLSPNAGRSQRPHQTKAQLQAERIHRLNAIMQKKRRTEQAASVEQGVR